MYEKIVAGTLVASLVIWALGRVLSILIPDWAVVGALIPYAVIGVVSALLTMKEKATVSTWFVANMGITTLLVLLNGFLAPEAYWEAEIFWLNFGAASATSLLLGFITLYYVGAG